ncbi:MAG: hypothetical protein WC613_03650 [Candidatus Aenigmatarchaeota archaeon]
MKSQEKYYACEKCGLRYKEKKWSDKCYAWCKRHQSCNILIIKHAVK